MFHLAGHGAFFALLQVILIDLVLAGDNAVVIGMAAARVPQAQRRKVIFWGLAVAVILRVGLATITVQLFNIIPLRITGGILLLWVAWRLYRDIKRARDEKVRAKTNHSSAFARSVSAEADTRMVRSAILRIAIADISMSLDNVLAVAGVAINHKIVLVIGLMLSIGLMGIAASFVAKLLQRYPWISYAGVFIVLYVALSMIYRGSVMIAQTPS